MQDDKSDLKITEAELLEPSQEALVESLPQGGYFFAPVTAGAGGPAVVVTESGPDPAGKGEPKTGTSAPVVPSMVYAETLAEPSFAT